MDRWTRIWCEVGGEWLALEAREPFWFAPHDERGALVGQPVDPRRPPCRGSVLVFPIRPFDGLCAVVVPPDGQSACLDGRRLPKGPTAVLHGQELRVGSRRGWFSVACEPRLVRYDPLQHGPRARSADDGIPLVPGEPVIACAGTPRRECEALRRRSAFVPGSPCPVCGSDPNPAEWTPPPHAPLLHEVPRGAR